MSFFVDSLIRVNDVVGSPQRIGEFSTRDEAFAASRRSIDEYLQREFRPGMSAQTLYTRFREFAAVPVVFGDGVDPSDVLRFNPIKYALERAEQICGGALPQKLTAR